MKKLELRREGAIGELQDRLKWNLLRGLSNEYRDDRSYYQSPNG